MTVRATKSDYLVKMWGHWRKRLNLPDRPIVRDNRYTGHLISIIDPDNGLEELRYNSRHLSHWTKPMILFGIFHEFGHEKYYQEYGFIEDEDAVEELWAERYALRLLREHYPKYVPRCVAFMNKRLNQKWWQKKYPIHYIAFRDFYNNL